MNQIQYNSLKYFALFCCLIVSCQSVVKQLYEDSTARFNSYFIAKEDIKKTEEIINNAYKWNYDDIIPIISPLDTNNVSQYNDLTINAIEKASLLIQRHPESSLVLNSYILIGLARLYNFDFESAETTFKYVNTKAKDINIKNLALIYLMRSYFENNKIKEAIEVYKYLEKNIINKKNKILFYLNSAYVFQVLENYDETLKNLSLVENLVTNNNQENKILFLIGQIYQKSDFKNEAYEYYKKCLKNNPSFELSFYTKINLAKVTELTNSNDIKKVYKYFNRLLKDKKNMDYLDKIYYEIGEFEYNQKKIKQAIYNYNKSLNTDQNNTKQKFLNYKKLAEIYYADFKNYELSKLYYDSSLNNTNRENIEYNNLYERREILQELVNNLTTIKKNDSLIQLSALSQEEINKIADNYIKELEKKQEKEKKIINRSFNFNDNQKEIIRDNTQTNTWYFYNDIMVSRGREEFKRIWGNRNLTDNWRISRKIIFEESSESIVKNEKISKSKMNQSAENNKIDRKKLIASIPFSKEEKQKLSDEIETAYYKVGNIYIQKLNEIELGKDYFLKLLYEFKKSRYIPEILYQLYLISKETNPEEANNYKEKLLKAYPNHLMSKLVINPNYEQDQFAENNLLINEYDKLYKIFEDKHYEIVIKKSDSIIKKFTKNPYHQKFMLLQALAKGKLDGNFIFQLSLKKIIKKAEDNEIIQFSKELLKSSEEVNNEYYYSGKPKFIDNENTSNYYSVFIISNDNQIENKTIQILEKIMIDMKYKKRFIDQYNFTDKETLIIISDLNQVENKNIIKEFEMRYKEKIPILSKFVITENNMKILFETKKYSEYLQYLHKTKNNDE